jgi:hypothetical protein
MIKTYTNIEDLENDFKNDILTPQLLKASLSKLITSLLDDCNKRINERLKNDNEFREGYERLLKLRANKLKKQINK